MEPPLTAHAFVIRRAREGDAPGAYHVCLRTGDHGRDGEAFYREDPDALGRIYVGPYLAFEPDLSLILEDDLGICGYALGAFDSRAFYARYETEWRPELCARFPGAAGRSGRMDARAAGPPRVSCAGLLLPRALRSLSLASAHRPAAAGPGTWAMDVACSSRSSRHCAAADRLVRISA